MRDVILDLVTVLGFLRETEAIGYVCMNIHTCIYVYGDIDTDRDFKNWLT